MEKSIFTIPSMLYAEQWLPKDVHILNIGSHDYAIFQGKGGGIKVADGIRLRLAQNEGPS